MATGTTSHARQLERIPSNTPVTLLFEFQNQPHRQRARLLDISDSGMRLKTGAALVPGQEVQIISTHGMQEPERARVVWVSASVSDPTFLAGVEFLNPHQADPSVATREMVAEHSRPGAAGVQPDDETRRVVGDDRGPLAKP